MTPGAVTPEQAWAAISQALDANARGNLSAADVCGVGFDLQGRMIDAAMARHRTQAEQRPEAPAPQQPNGTVARAQQYFDSAKDQLEQIDRTSDPATQTMYVGRAVDDLCDGLTHLASAVASEADRAGWREAVR